MSVALQLFNFSCYITFAIKRECYTDDVTYGETDGQPATCRPS